MPEPKPTHRANVNAGALDAHAGDDVDLSAWPPDTVKAYEDAQLVTRLHDDPPADLPTEPTPEGQARQAVPTERTKRRDDDDDVQPVPVDDDEEPDPDDDDDRPRGFGRFGSSRSGQ